MRWCRSWLPSHTEARASARRIERTIDEIHPGLVHLATEGSIGWFTCYVYQTSRDSFTTIYHTRFPEWLAARLPEPLAWNYTALGRSHNSGDGIMAGSPIPEKTLKMHGFRELMP